MDDMPFTAADLIDTLANRHSFSPKALHPPGVTPQDWQQIMRLPLRAPDHRRLQPYRFVLIHPEQRNALGELFALAAQRRHASPEEQDQARARAHHAPSLLAVVARLQTGIKETGVEDVPEHEQWICVGGAVMNLLNGLHLLGYGAKVVSGSSVRDPQIQAAFCSAPGEQLVAWIVAGTPHARAQPRPVEAPVPLWTDWAGPPEPGLS